MTYSNTIRIDGSSRADTFTYNASSQAGTAYRYDGDGGYDTLRLLLTREQWMSAAFQADLERLRAYFAEGRLSRDFSFTAFPLSMEDIEAIDFVVDGTVLSLADDAVFAVNDAYSVLAAGSVSGNVTANDRVADLVRSVELVSKPAAGTLALRPDGSFTYQAGPDFAYLAAGEATQVSFSYRVTDADGDSGTATVTITVTGTNEGPVVTGAKLAGAVTEAAVPGAALTDRGTITFSDVDLRDVHTASAAAIGPVLGAVTARVVTDTTGRGTGGSVEWVYSVEAGKLEYLAAGETRIERFTVTLSDGQGGTVSRSVEVTLTGTNDAPTITSAAQAGSGTEDIPAPATCTISFTDVDLSDGHTASVVPASGQTALGRFALTAVDEAANAATGSLGWSYVLDQAKAQFLAAGETRREVFTVIVDDGRGGTASQDVTITITGTNDAPTITGGSVAGGVTELATPVGSLTSGGSISFADLDLRDGHSVTAVAQGSVLGTLSPRIVTDTTGSGASGSLGWAYAVEAGKVEYLAAGETRVERFTLTVDDGQGGRASQDVAVTITGTNDAPTITGGSFAAGLTEQATPAGTLSAASVIAFADVDLRDVHSVTIAPVGTVLGSASVTQLADTTGTGAGGRFAWSYGVEAGKLEYLAAGETRVERFTVTLSDGQGGTVVRPVEVTLTGTNDAPILASGELVRDGDFSAGGQGWANTGGLVEVYPSWAYGVDPAAGAVMEVDYANALDTVSQTIATQAGQTYVFSFDTALRAGTRPETNTFEVLWNGQVIDRVTAASTAFERHSYAVVATGPSGTLAFREILNDGYGGLVDNVSLRAPTALSERAGTAGSDALDRATTTLSFTDADLGDRHTLSAKLASATASKGVLPTATQAALAGALGLGLAADSTGGAAGQVTATFALPDRLADFLAAGESLTVTYDVTVSDANGGASTRPVSFVITGTNDAPTITGGSVAAGLAELRTPAGSLTGSGSIGFADLDLTDAHTVAAAPAGDVLGALTARVVTDTTGRGTGGSVEWVYSVEAGKLEYLAAGEMRIERFTVTLSDGQGGTVSRSVEVTLTGTNDAPTITSAAQAGSVTEDAPVPATGTISFTDADLSDGHTASVVAASSQTALGRFALTAVDEAANAATGSLGWSYVLDQAKAQFLAAGETRREVFTVIVDDGRGGTASQDVTVTITGTNDAPTITGGSVAGGVTELATPVGSLTSGGSIGFADLDLRDGHSVTAVAQGSVLGTLSPRIVSDTTGSGANGSLGWAYAVEAGKVEYLAAGETRVERFTLTVDDGQGGTASEDVAVTITGTNDAPTITSAVQAGSVTEDAPAPATGTISFTDVDLSDGHTASFVPAPGQTALGYFSLTAVDEAANAATGSLGWSYVLDQAQAQFLAAGETRREAFTVSVDDGQGGTASQDVTITITGTNDAPTITSATQTGSVTEDVTAPATGTITFADVDLVDGHTASFVPAPGQTALGHFALTEVDEAADAATGSLGWSYVLDQAKAQFLAAGETRREIFTVIVDDGRGGRASQDVTVTITGTNDAPTITSAAQAGSVTEDAPAPATGTISFTDVDLSDGHTASFVPAPGQTALGHFALTAVDEAADAATGSLGWSYVLDQAKAQFLAAGETRQEVFTVTVDDGQGGIASQDVTVTITGTNDAPVVLDITGATAATGSPPLVLHPAYTDVDTRDTHGLSLDATPTRGHVALNADGTFSYDPNGAFANLPAGITAQDSFTYTVTDSAGAAVTRTATVTVTGTNHSPVAAADQQTAAREGLTVLDLLANDGDPDGDALAITAVTQPLEGRVTIENGRAVFDPGSTFAGLAAGQTATVSFAYTVSDGRGGTDTASATVQVQGSGAFVPGNQTDTSSTVLTSNKQAVFLQLDGASRANDGSTKVTATIGLGTVQQPAINIVYVVDTSGSEQTFFANGIGDLNGDGTANTRIDAEIQALTALSNKILAQGFNPASTRLAIVPFDSAGKTFGVNGSAPEAKPVFALDAAGVSSATSYLKTLRATGGTNYEDALRSTISALAVMDPNRTASNFVYFVSDGEPTSQNAATPANQVPASGTTGVVTINPSPTNQAAIIAKFADEVKTLTEVYKAKISAIGIGDSSLTYLDPIDNTGGAEKVTTPSALSASLLGSPVPSASIAAFTLSVNARVVPGITKANLVSTPLGLKIDANLAALKPYLGDSNTVVASVTFTDGTTLVTDLVVTGVLPHAFDPPGLGASPPSEILVEAGAETAGVPESVVRLVRAANAPAYDTAGWTQLTPATFAKAGTYGTTLLDTAANTLTYALDNARSATNALQAGAIVTEKVEIRLVGGLNKDIAFTITGSNDAPVAADAAASGDEDGVLAGQLSAIDPDTSVDDLIVALVGEAAHGHVAIDARGHYTYTPDADFNGTDQFTYRVNDGSDAGNVATVTLTVRPVEDAPRVAGPLTLEADEGSAARLLDLLLNARDADGDALAITDLRYSVDGQPSAAPPAGLSLSGSTLAVDPSDPAFDALAEGATRTIVAAYDIVDGQGGSVRQTQTLVLHGVNDAPSASSAAAATEAGTPLSGSVSASDIDGDALTYSVGTAPVHGTLSLGADGRYTYAPDAGYAGSDGFTFTASDGRLAATGTIDLTVKPDAAAPPANGGTAASVVTGTAGDDVLQGGAGDDRLDGRGGDDLLSGGAGADTFVFSPLAGHARIADFEIHRDVVEVSSNAFADEAAILAQATQVGADTVISLDATHSLTLQNVATASLTAADFHVV